MPDERTLGDFSASFMAPHAGPGYLIPGGQDFFPETAAPYDAVDLDDLLGPFVPPFMPELDDEFLN
jgi:hypothetical protein